MNGEVDAIEGRPAGESDVRSWGTRPQRMLEQVAKHATQKQRVADEVYGRRAPVGLEPAAAAYLIVKIDAAVSLVWSSMIHYSGLDYLWWTLLAFLLARLLHTENPRYWLGIGVVLGLGMLTKHTMAVCAAGLVAGVFFFSPRGKRYRMLGWIAVVSFIVLLAVQSRKKIAGQG